MRSCMHFFIWTFFCLSDGFCQSVVDQNILSLIHNHWPGEVFSDGSNVKISRTVSKIGEIQHYYIQQQWNDIEIMSAINSVHLQANNKYYSPNRFFPISVLQGISTIARIEHEQSVQIALAEIFSDFSIQKNVGYEAIVHSELLKKEAKVKLNYIADSTGKLFLCYNWQLEPKESSDIWEIFIDINSGSIIQKINRKLSCSFSPLDAQKSCVDWDQNKQYTSFNPWSTNQSSSLSEAKYHVYALPIENPNHGQRTMETDGQDTIASPLGWQSIETGMQIDITKGNNVHAYFDSLLADLSIGNEPSGGDKLVFDFPLSPNQTTHPKLNPNPGTVNAFYTANRIHDILYHYGFDEQAGNYQFNNFDKGGFGNDHTIIECPDLFAIDNANAWTGVDGDNLRIQMFPWTRYYSYDLKILDEHGAWKAMDILRFKFGLAPSSKKQQFILQDYAKLFPEDPYACNPIPISLNKTIVLIKRGDCKLLEKILNVQRAGAAAVIIVNFNDELFSIPELGESNKVNIMCFSCRLSVYEQLKIYLEKQNLILLDEEEDRSKKLIFDSGFDNGIIAHEYMHGVSNRLTGGPNNVSCLIRGEQMGEGWSDFLGGLLTFKNEAEIFGLHSIGTMDAPNHQVYSGIRRAPYSIDKKYNDFDYNDIDGRYEVGEVWALCLFDLLGSMVTKYGFDPNWSNQKSGNAKTLQLVMEGMKLQACQPGIVDGRNAILLADTLINNSENACQIWESFARRGVGYFASQGSSLELSDESINFESCPQCSHQISIVKNAPDFIFAGDTIRINIGIYNNTKDQVNEITIADSIPSNCTVVHGSSNYPFTSISKQAIDFQFPGLASGDSIQINYLLYSDPMLQSKFYWMDSLSDVVTLDQWETQVIQGVAEWEYEENVIDHSKSWVYELNQIGIPSEAILSLKNTIHIESGKELFVFFHHYNLKYKHHGAIVEVSTDHGQTWNYVPAHDIMYSTYKGKLNPTVNGKENFYCYNNISTTELEMGIMNLETFIGKDVKIRFHLVLDQYSLPISSNFNGWILDNVGFIRDPYFYQSGLNTKISGKSLSSVQMREKGILVIPNTLPPTHTFNNRDNKQTIVIFPNPVQSKFKLVSNSELPKNSTYDIYNLMGHKVISNFDQPIKNGEDIDITALSSGLYILKVYTPFCRIAEISFIKI